MDAINTDAGAAFDALRARLQAGHPDAYAEAERLADLMLDPATAEAEPAWRLIWDKPLYANTRVAIADRAVAAIEPLMPGVWRDMADPNGPYAIARVGKGFAKDSFAITGEKAAALAAKGIAPHRLLAIVNGGRVLQARATARPAPFSDLVGRSIVEAVALLRYELGFGWGQITVLHLLTDLGLACKPDIHLVRSVRALGLMPWLPPGDDAPPEMLVHIAEAVKTFTAPALGEASPRNLRMMDKWLMEISRQGLLGTAAG